MPLGVLTSEPGLTGAVKHVLCAQDVGFQEEARIGDTAVHMALGGKVNDIVHVKLPHDALNQFAVAHVTTHEGDIRPLYFLLDRSQVTGIGQCIKDDDLDVVAILIENVFHKV